MKTFAVWQQSSLDPHYVHAEEFRMAGLPGAGLWVEFFNKRVLDIPGEEGSEIIVGYAVGNACVFEMDEQGVDKPFEVRDIESSSIMGKQGQ